MQEAEKIALFDMDDTTAEYTLSMNAELLQIASPADLLHPDYTSSRLEYVERRRDLIKAQPSFWRNLAVHEPGVEIMNILIEFGYQPQILTKGPGRATCAWQEKFLWCQDRMADGTFPEKTPVHIMQDKGLVYGKVLVDDWPPYGLRWLKWRPRGLLVLPAQSWNDGFEHPNAFRYDGNRTELRERLKRLA